MDIRLRPVSNPIGGKKYQLYTDNDISDDNMKLFLHDIIVEHQTFGDTSYIVLAMSPNIIGWICYLERKLRDTVIDGKIGSNLRQQRSYLYAKVTSEIGGRCDIVKSLILSPTNLSVRDGVIQYQISADIMYDDGDHLPFEMMD